jgi:hypothetical protein
MSTATLTPDAPIDHDKPRTVAIATHRPFREWLDRFASHKRLTRSILIDQALTRMAAEEGFTPPPPR